MNERQIEDLVKKYLSETLIMQLATIGGDRPWVCNLHFVADDDSNVYWLSKASRRHSHDIESHPDVAIAVAVQTEKPLIGIQAEGNAEQVTDLQQRKDVMAQYVKRHGTDQSFADQIIAGTNEHKLYQFTPKRYSLFDQANFSDDPSREWVIDHN
jgi:uncharacterized protein YhbP (UPF0306 family)